MSNNAKFAKERRKQEAVNALRELAKKIETGQLLIIHQGLWNGATQDIWNYKIELKENPIPVLAETLSKD